jgi:Leucine rich repeat/Leucine Rich repeat
MGSRDGNELDGGDAHNRNNWSAGGGCDDEEETGTERMNSCSLDTLAQLPKPDPPTVGSAPAALTHVLYTLPSGNLADAKNTLRAYSMAAAAANVTAVGGMSTAMDHTNLAALPSPDVGVTRKNTMQPSADGAAATAPSTEMPEPMLMATAVADSVLNATPSANSQDVAAPATSSGWKPQTVMLCIIAVLLLAIAVIGGVCATGGCFSLSTAANVGPSPVVGATATNIAVPTSPPTTITVAIPPPPQLKTVDPVLFTTPSPTVKMATNNPMHLDEASRTPTMGPTEAPIEPLTSAIPTMTPTDAFPTVSPTGTSSTAAPKNPLSTISPMNPPTPPQLTASPSFAPKNQLFTITPTVSPRAEQVTSFINSITLTGRAIAVVSGSTSTATLDPEELALHWLVHYDTDLNLLPNTTTNRFRLQQRYALAILRVQQDDTNPFFGSIDTECKWNGITCQSLNLGNELGMQQAVTAIDIDTYNYGNKWTGHLSADLGLLSTLRNFSMSCGICDDFGGLFGSLPSEIGKLTNLELLVLPGNRLTGSLPSQIGQLSNLKIFDVLINAWTGSLPTQIGQLTNLTILDVSYNALTGSLPTQVGQLTNLRYFDASRNALIGSLPTQIGQLTNLTTLDVSRNALTGSLPSQIGQLTSLTYLNMTDNKLSRSLPSQIGQLARVQLFDVSGNTLMGSLPTQIGQMTTLQLLSLHENAFTGSLPNQMGQLTNLVILGLFDNNFVGTMPYSVCLIRIQTLLADCVFEVSCNCCTLCI